jgi:hypothetical protein
LLQQALPQQHLGTATGIGRRVEPLHQSRGQWVAHGQGGHTLEQIRCRRQQQGGGGHTKGDGATRRQHARRPQQLAATATTGPALQRIRPSDHGTAAIRAAITGQERARTCPQHGSGSPRLVAPPQGPKGQAKDTAAERNGVRQTSDDDLEDDDLGANEPLDEPGEEVVASRSEPSDALKAERRQTNQLERELRTIKRQLAQFFKINPDEYERLQEAERQKEQLDREIASRELQLEAAAARKVKAAVKERDEALQDVQNLRKERLLERLFVDADGRASC